METPRAVVPMAPVRERVIQQLTSAFADDLITVDELESRLEQVYRAQTPAEAEALVAGLLPAAAPSPDRSGTDVRRPGAAPGLTPIHDRFVALFSASARRGVWSVPHQFDIYAFFSDAVVDLTAAQLPGDLVDINVRGFAASLKIVVPPGIRVVNRVGALLANVSSDTALDLAPMVPGSPVIRVTGFAMMASVEIVAAPTTDDRESA
jgi:hypothetical protein